MTRNQTIAILVGALFLLVIALMIMGILPGLAERDSGPQVKATLRVWTFEDNRFGLEAALNAFAKVYPDVRIELEASDDAATFERRLVDALAGSRGPDIFTIHHAALPRFVDKIVPAPANLVSLLNLRALFPEVVEQDLAREGAVYALPLSIDTPVLLYNRDLFNKAAVVFPPTTWIELEAMVPKLVKKTNSSITEAAIALGESERNIAGAGRLLELLMLQNGAFEERGGTVTLNINQSRDALRYYAGFSNPALPIYTWNATLPRSEDMMAQERLAMMVGTRAALKSLERQNRFLNLGVAPVPQLAGAAKPAVNADYWAYAVSAQSGNQALAWELVAAMTTNSDLADAYVKATGNPPALKTLIGAYLNDPELNVFARQALIAKSWPKIDESAMNKAFSDAIDAVNHRGLEPAQALDEVERQYRGLMQ